jgi:AmiR/NasT family two-component response regulator
MTTTSPPDGTSTHELSIARVRQRASDEPLVDVLRARVADLETKIDNYEIALHSARQIGMAMGIVMAGRRCTPEAAFEVLRACSQQLHRKLRDIADEVVLTGDLPAGSTGSR